MLTILSCPPRHPGTLARRRLATHTHAWALAKVGGRWRLLDPARAVLLAGHVPFFLPPDAFCYSYWPLEAAWQLLAEPLPLGTWWEVPHASVEFFAARG